MTTLTETTTYPPTGPLTQREVRDVMTPGVVTIVEDASLVQACSALRRHRVHAVLVVGRHQGKPLGWITARGLLGLLDHDPCTPARDAVVERDVATAPVVTARLDQPLLDAVRVMRNGGATHLLVLDPDSRQPLGVLSGLDLAATWAWGVG